jgi:secreted trypsin-like serine protease
MNRIRVAIILSVFGSITAHALVNGTPVTDEQFEADFPWSVAVVNKANGGICGGVLITPNWVLTAAHCTGINKHVLVGHAERALAQPIDVSRAIRHPQFDKETLQYDVGLLQLEESVDLRSARLPTLAQARGMLIPGQPAELAGWGKTETQKYAVERMQIGTIKLENLALQGTQIIYNYRGGGPCGLDSGGPMVMRMPDGRRLVVGVASATGGALCTQGGGVAIYTNLALIRAFILKHVDSFW